MHRCQICATQLPNSLSLLLHLAQHALENNSRTVSKNNADNGFTCHQCSRVFIRYFNLQRHIKVCKGVSISTSSSGKTTTTILHSRAITSERRCRYCDKMFTRNNNFRNHELTCGKKRYGKHFKLPSDVSYPDGRKKKRNMSKKCDFCPRKFVNRSKCVHHMNRCQMGGVRSPPQKYKYRCLTCNQLFKSRDQKRRHYQKCIGSGLDNLDTTKFVINLNKKFKDTVYEYRILPEKGRSFLTNISLWKMVLAIKPIIHYFQTHRKKYPAIKVEAILKSEFNPATNLHHDINDSSKDIYLHAKNKEGKKDFICYPASDIRTDICAPIYKAIVKALDDFEHEGSGWRLKTYSRLDIIITVINPLRVSSCHGNEHMLPLNLAKKHALLQVEYDPEQKDNHCFIWAVYASLYAASKPDVKEKVDIKTLSDFIESNEMCLDFSMIKE